MPDDIARLSALCTKNSKVLHKLEDNVTQWTDKLVASLETNPAQDVEPLLALSRQMKSDFVSDLAGDAPLKLRSRQSQSLALGGAVAAMYAGAIDAVLFHLADKAPLPLDGATIDRMKRLDSLGEPAGVLLKPHSKLIDLAGHSDAKLQVETARANPGFTIANLLNHITFSDYTSASSSLSGLHDHALSLFETAYMSQLHRASLMAAFHQRPVQGEQLTQKLLQSDGQRIHDFAETHAELLEDFPQIRAHGVGFVPGQNYDPRDVELGLVLQVANRADAAALRPLLQTPLCDGDVRVGVEIGGEVHPLGSRRWMN